MVVISRLSLKDERKKDKIKGDNMKLTREEAIKILIRVTDKDDPYWENLVDEYYDEATDTMPIFDDVLRAIGVSDEELKMAWEEG